MIKWLKTWWQVKKMSRAIWRQVKIEQQRQDAETQRLQEHVDEIFQRWIKDNEFGLTREQLETHCVSRVEKNHAKNIDRELKCQ
jgi:hypothetical protein